MPEVIRNRFRDQDARSADFQDTARVRPGFGADEDPLAELARIVGETGPVPAAQVPQSPRGPIAARPGPQPGTGPANTAARETASQHRDYPRRDTSWRDPQARTTVRAGITPQTMPGQLQDLEAELFSELRSENIRNLPPAPDLPQLGLTDARSPQYDATTRPGASLRASMPTGRPAAAPAPRTSHGGTPVEVAEDDEVTLPMHAVLRAMPPSDRASEELGMQQSSRYNTASAHPSVPAPAEATGPAAAHDYHGHETYSPEDYDPSDALGAAYRDYDELEAAYYASGHDAQASHHAIPPGNDPAMGEGYSQIQSHYGDHLDAHYDDEDAYADELRSPIAAKAPQRQRSPLLLGFVSVVVLAALGVGSFAAYRTLGGGNATGANAPLIRADTKPMKELVAQQPLGASGPNLDTARPDGQDKLVTQTEDPVDTIPGKPPVRVVGPGAGTPSLAPVQRVRSVIVRPDGTIVAPDDPAVKPAQPVRTASLPTDTPVAAPPSPVAQAQASQAAAPSTPPASSLPPLNPVAHIDSSPVVQKPNPAPPIVAPKQPAAQASPPVKPAARPAVPPAAPAQVAHSGDQNAPLALGPSSSPATPVHVATATPVAPPPVQHQPTLDAGTGDYMVQISSQRSDSEARHALASAEQKYASLGIKGGDVQQADLGARGTYYRARLAGGTHEQAMAICQQIKSQGGDCVVAKR